MTTRRKLIGTAAAMSALAFPFIARAAARELRIAVWDGYAEPEWVAPFQEEFDVEVKVTYLTSDDEWLTAMRRSGGAGVDAFSLNTSLVPLYHELELIQAIDLSKITRADHLLPAYRNVADLGIDGQIWGVPFAWGSQPLIYDKAQFQNAPDSWAVMWDPAHSGRLINFDDPGTITLAALLLGFPNPYRLDQGQLQACKALLIKQKPLILKYYTGFDEGVKLFSENRIKAMLSIGELQQVKLQDAGIDAGLVIPKEGATGWLDCWVISAGANSPDLATEWINHCMASKVSVILSSKLKYGNTTFDQSNFENGLTYSDKLFFAQQPEDFEKRAKIWDEIKAA